MPRVVLVSTYPPTHCGVAEYTRFLVTSLRSLPYRKLEIKVIGDEGSMSGTDSEAGVEIIPTFRVGCADSLSRVIDVLTEIDGTDILHIQHEYDIYTLSHALESVLEEVRDERLAKVVVITLHTVYTPVRGLESRVEIQRGLIEQVDAVIVHSIQQEFELYTQGVPPRKVYRIPHGTLINPYLHYSRRFLSEKLGIPFERLRGIVLTVPGFVRKDKGLDILIQALSKLKDLKLTVVVAGEVRDREVKKHIEEATREGKMIMIERYLSNDELLMLVALSDAIVLPYRDAPGILSVSGILHISMGSLKPLLGSRVPRLVELYQNAPRLTFRPEEPEELAQKIRWLVKNYDYTIAYASALYSYAVRTQWLRMARRHLSLYLELVKDKVEGKQA
ncbi:MAG: group 1 glycosyl transferase [Thermoprotei archaeon]|nr:MAG: group 1 glycosyl transferase [Thermoprotei archaeon]